MPTIPVVNNLIEDEKQTIVATGGQVVDLDEEARPKRDNGIDDIDPTYYYCDSFGWQDITADIMAWSRYRDGKEMVG